MGTKGLVSVISLLLLTISLAGCASTPQPGASTDTGESIPAGTTTEKPETAGSGAETAAVGSTTSKPEPTGSTPAGVVIDSTDDEWLVGKSFGAALGYNVGNEWDMFDERQAQSTFQSGEAFSWKSNEGREYNAVPGKAYNENGRELRNMTVTDSTGRESKVTLGKRNDGKWEFVE